MGRGEYHKTTAYKKSVKKGKDSLGDALGLLALPLLPVAIPVKIVSDLKKAGKKTAKKKK